VHHRGGRDDDKRVYPVDPPTAEKCGIPASTGAAPRGRLACRRRAVHVSSDPAATMVAVGVLAPGFAVSAAAIPRPQVMRPHALGREVTGGVGVPVVRGAAGRAGPTRPGSVGPAWTWPHAPHVLPHFVRGLYDGDGGFHHDKRNPFSPLLSCYTSLSEGFVRRFYQEIVLSAELSVARSPSAGAGPPALNSPTRTPSALRDGCTKTAHR